MYINICVFFHLYTWYPSIRRVLREEGKGDMYIQRLYIYIYVYSFSLLVLPQVCKEQFSTGIKGSHRRSSLNLIHQTSATLPELWTQNCVKTLLSRCFFSERLSCQWNDLWSTTLTCNSVKMCRQETMNNGKECALRTLLFRVMRIRSCCYFCGAHSDTTADVIAGVHVASRARTYRRWYRIHSRSSP